MNYKNIIKFSKQEIDKFEGDSNIVYFMHLEKQNMFHIQEELLLVELIDILIE